MINTKKRVDYYPYADDPDLDDIKVKIPLGTLRNMNRKKKWENHLRVCINSFKVEDRLISRFSKLFISKG